MPRRFAVCPSEIVCSPAMPPSSAQGQAMSGPYGGSRDAPHTHARPMQPSTARGAGTRITAAGTLARRSWPERSDIPRFQRTTLRGRRPARHGGARGRCPMSRWRPRGSCVWEEGGRGWKGRGRSCPRARWAAGDGRAPATSHVPASRSAGVRIGLPRAEARHRGSPAEDAGDPAPPAIGTTGGHPGAPAGARAIGHPLRTPCSAPGSRRCAGSRGR